MLTQNCSSGKYRYKKTHTRPKCSIH